MSLYHFILQLMAMLILSGVLTAGGLLTVFRAYDWWAAR